MKKHLLFAVLCLLGTSTVQFLQAQNPLRLIVTSSLDDANARDAQPGDGVCEDDNGRCTLRAAVDEANAASGDVIIILPGLLPGGNSGNFSISRVAPNMASNTYEDNNAYGDLDLNGTFSSLAIQGTGTPGPKVTSSPNDRIFDVGAGKTVSFSRLWVTGGTANAGENGTTTAPDATNGANGGALRIGDNATVDIDQCAFTGNFTQSGGNGATPATSISRTTGGDAGNGGDGGAIYISSGASVNINRTTIEGNGTGDAGGAGSGQATGAADGGTGGDGGNGGGIYNAGNLTVKNSTIANNTLGGASTGGSGVNGGTAGNDGAGGSGGGIANAQFTGSGLTNEGTASITNSIVAGNTAGQSVASTIEPGPDFFDATNGGTFTLNSNNLIGSNDGVTNITGNLIGTSGSPIDPLISGVNSNSDFAVPVAVLGSNSPAIDAGTSTTGNNYDARGFERPFGGSADIGAFEDGSQRVTITLQVNEIDINTVQTDEEFVEIANTGNYTAQLDDYALVGFNSLGTSCLAANLYGELEPGEVFVVGEMSVSNLDQMIDLDLFSNSCGNAPSDKFLNTTGAVAIYAGTASNYSGFTAGNFANQREDVIVYENGGGTSGSSLLNLCSMFGQSSGCGASDPGDGASIQRDGSGGTITATPSPGDINSGQALPVELVELAVQASGKTEAMLSWSTLQEIDNAGFEVEQLVGKDWVILGWISGQGTTDMIQHYRFEVSGLPSGTHAFRLQQEDFDGTRTASEAVSLRIDGTTEVALAPNPVRGSAILSFTLPTGGERVTITLLDGFGRQLQELHNGNLPEGVQTLPIDLSNETSGLYYVRIQGRTLNSMQPLQRL